MQYPGQLFDFKKSLQFAIAVKKESGEKQAVFFFSG
jgi:hypothetical protein